MHHDSVAVVDFGGQYAHLIATKVRRLGLLARVLQPEDEVGAFRPYGGGILSGSPSGAALAALGGFAFLEVAAALVRLLLKSRRGAPPAPEGGRGPGPGPPPA